MQIKEPLLIKIKFLLVFLFVASIPLLLWVESATTLLWTIALPLLPLFILIIGYSNWRKVCPLAFFSQLSQSLTWLRKRKVPLWFEDNFYAFQYLLLLLAFSMRLILLNFDANALVVFLILVIVLSFVINLFFTGKSWCNFFCPVGIVEKIYCLSNAKNAQIDSACSTCSACKKNCPDIDMESNYWKEASNTQKTFVFYAFSGLVLGFYLSFYLQSGSFEMYFTGVWTSAPLGFFSDGFFFAPFVPLFIAVPLTLIVFSLLSFGFFYGLERLLWNKKIFQGISHETLNHKIKVLASFMAFNIFYVFAGAPSYSQYPLLYALFYFVVIFVSTLVLHKEIFREQSFFIQERFALNMIKRWKNKSDIPSNLKEIYYTYANQNRDKKEKLKHYKESVLDLLHQGILTSSTMIILDRLRDQMGISQTEHLKIIKSIESKDKSLFNEDNTQSSEAKYQKVSYTKVLYDSLMEHRSLSHSLIESLRKQFCITEQMHKEIMDEILNSNKNLHHEVIDTLKQMNRLRRVHKSIFDDKSREISFLKYTIRNEFNAISKDLFSLLKIIYNDDIDKIESIQNHFSYSYIGHDINMENQDLTFMYFDIAKGILELTKDFNTVQTVKDNTGLVKYLLTVPSMTISSSALLCALHYPESFFEDVSLEKFFTYPHDSIGKLAQKVKDKSSEMTHYEGMMYVHAIPIFSEIKFYELKAMVKAMSILNYKQDEYLITQGDKSDTLFIIVSGEVEVSMDGEVINHLGDQDYFGDIPLLADLTRIASVKAISSNVKVFTLSKKAFKTFIHQNPEISTKLMKKIIQKLIVQDKSRVALTKEKNA